MDITLADELAFSAEWREHKAEEYPDDARNSQSAKALRTAASEVAALPDDDPRLVRLARLGENGDEDALDHYVEGRGRIIGRHGFGRYDTQTTDELLAALVKLADESEAKAEPMRSG